MWLYFVGWFIGICIGSFLVIQPLIILFFAIPFTIKLRNMSALDLNAPIHTKNLLALIVQVTMFLTITWLVEKSNNLFVGYCVGIGIVLLMGIGKIFKTKDNVADFIEGNIRSLHPDFVTEYLVTILETEVKSNRLIKHVAFIDAHTGRSSL